MRRSTASVAVDAHWTLPAPVCCMAKGGAVSAPRALITGVPWTFSATPSYLLSLAYLALFGSVVAFVSYLTLAGDIGADRAGYVGVVTPVVALGLSTVLEGYRWSVPAVAGACLCLFGNLLILKKPGAPMHIQRD